MMTFEKKVDGNLGFNLTDLNLIFENNATTLKSHDIL